MFGNRNTIKRAIKGISLYCLSRQEEGNHYPFGIADSLFY